MVLAPFQNPFCILKLSIVLSLILTIIRIDITHANESASPDEVQYWYRNYDSHTSLSMLRLALEATTDLYGPPLIVRSEEFTQGRASLFLEHNKADMLDVVEFVPDADRLGKLTPIYVALEEGLVGHRVCLIRKEDEEKFKGIRTVKDFNQRNLTIGQGSHWPDVKILEANGFKVDTTVEYEALYRMLEAGRFDCFLRGAHEINEDYEKHKEAGLMIEPHLVFVYPSISIFFVAKENKELAMRIELGLRRALLENKFEGVFDALYATKLEQLNLPQRRKIYLNNPLLEDEVLINSTKHGITVDGKIAN